MTVAAPLGLPFSLAVVAAVATLVALAWVDHRTRPPRPIVIGHERPGPHRRHGLEPPAVVALLTSGYRVPTAAVPATVLDLSRRGWIRLAATDDGELVVFTRGRGRHGDVLRPFEQQVLNHLTARSFDGVTTAGTLLATADRLDRRWWYRFRRDVARAAAERGLVTVRYTPATLLAPLALAAVAGFAAWRSVSPGRPAAAVSDSLAPRALWVVTVLAVVVAAVALARRFGSTARTPTEIGEVRAGSWLGYRARLAERVPSPVGVVAPGDQQLAVGYGVAMGLFGEVLDQVPIVREEHRRAWSEAGGIPHVVDVRYPMRPGYGRNPVILAAVGLVVAFAARQAQLHLRRVADGEAWESLIDRIPGDVSIVQRVAEVLAEVMWAPMLWAAWAVAAGAIDTVVTRQRIGEIVRVRRPVDVVPPLRVLRALAERDRFSVYLAVDDGRRRRTAAWVANERTAAPQGAFARVRATPVLGHVRSTEPVGTSTRPDPRVSR